MCPKHIPSSHFIPPLHPSHVLKFISPYLSLLVSPLPSLHPTYLCAALLALWQSHHTLSIKLLWPRRGAAAASQSPSLVPSVPVSLSVTLKRFRLPDIVCSACAAAGLEMGGIALETGISLALDWISLDIFSGLSQPSRWAISLHNKDGLA